MLDDSLNRLGLVLYRKTRDAKDVSLCTPCDLMCKLDIPIDFIPAGGLKLDAD